jgi:hypothetical protein
VWLWDGGIDVQLGDELNGYKAEGKVSTFAEAAASSGSDRITVRAPDVGGGADHNKVVVHDLGQPGEGQ